MGFAFLAEFHRDFCMKDGYMDKSTQSDFDTIYAQFAQDYDLESLNSSNDRLNLDTFIRNILHMRRLDAELDTLMLGGNIAMNSMDIKRISEVKDNIQEKNLALERALGIDRKSRKRDNQVSAAEYYMHLQTVAQQFLEQRLIKVYCPYCNVMVFRFSPVHEHTAFNVQVNCSQCHKPIRAQRKERDIFYDIAPSDRGWRKQYPAEIVQPKKTKSDEVVDTSDIPASLIISDGDDADVE
jgi:hypothetical protein